MPVSDFLSQRDAWLLLAVHLEAIGMPINYTGSVFPGLCLCIRYLYTDKLIDHDTYYSMGRQVDRALDGRLLLCPTGAAAPRVKWCLKFAEEC